MFAACSFGPAVEGAPKVEEIVPAVETAAQAASDVGRFRALGREVGPNAEAPRAGEVAGLSSKKNLIDLGTVAVTTTAEMQTLMDRVYQIGDVFDHWMLDAVCIAWSQLADRASSGETFTTTAAGWDDYLNRTMIAWLTEEGFDAVGLSFVAKAQGMVDALKLAQTSPSTVRIYLQACVFRG